MKKVKSFIKRKIEDIRVIKDCRKRIRYEAKRGRIVNTKFLAHIASVPEWTITMFNKPKIKK